MEFVDHPTLADLFATRQAELAVSLDYAFCSELAVTLCDVLGRLHRAGHAHLDLAAANIFVLARDGSRLKLIDFGRNYILTERVGTSARIRAASAYVAPELMGADSPDSIDTTLCDLYSYGVVLLQLAGHASHRMGEVGALESREDVERMLADLWMNRPSFASVIDQLVQGDPAQRAARFRTDQHGNPYVSARRMIDDQIAIQEALTTDETATRELPTLVTARDLMARGKKPDFTIMVPAPDASQGVQGALDETSRLTRWTHFALIVWQVSLVAMVVLTLADLFPTVQVFGGWVKNFETVPERRSRLGMWLRISCVAQRHSASCS